MTTPDPRLICGVDEAGRGPLCGSVVAAAVILDPARPIDGLADSKKLTEKRREQLAPIIRERALAWAVAEASVEEIDRLNILHATMLAMKRAVEALQIAPDEVLIDGNRCPQIAYPVQAIVKGDSLVAAISAASILAKTGRDAQMLALDALHPQYGLASHKGYPTAAHLAAIRQHGVKDFYRKSFGPVRAVWLNPPLFET
ncbi:ribonuclease HII [Denitromonas ohlonensis]|uniref:Ribonuclease HII n=2 Tax=Denitromonas TaxID=139331 RepID=A0A557SJL7_9RHOO|nr:ribonuclease HII [Denitromonas ohlonensis]TVO69521.1 ribonuclease HII [Denitromonas ohlonensis]TVO77621.1 ribonuclease HII [Denitromonas ohlonensis]TVT73139.1 MAG: ribonuclease HII [Denitromonas halophila]TVT74199.1 MAG: ribonuclease HII [Denitromonas halophila]